MLEMLQAIEPSMRIAPRASSRSAPTCSLTHAERAAIEALRPGVKRLQPGQVLYEQGDSSEFVHVLVDGWAFRYRTLGDGRRQIVDFALRGALLGFGPGRFMSHGVEARTICDVCVIRRARFDELLHHQPAVAMRLIRELARNEAMALERLMTVGRQSARERVAHLLIELMSRARQAGDKVTGLDFALPLTQTHIADAIGLTSVHVCRTLAALRKDGIVRLHGERLQILDIDRLVAEAGFVADDPMPWADDGDGCSAGVPSKVVALHSRARRNRSAHAG
jgi:CRP-like cAMP-binding protein